MKFWREHTALRLSLITALVIIGLILVFVGWKMTGTLSGLGIMILGVALLLCALKIYNLQYE